ncbi:hypothetical protein Ahy_B01g053230 [Arachis hypogaea]|uniref:Protein FAR1-RELATED SEQUENCE n=1 Tax=Arachis hypogaea TaxID=3818 RepID=A0A445ARH3_ARAHY|nr:hypothetical protein Ahy_B01g053230 [Arachis hypogaea]
MEIMGNKQPIAVVTNGNLVIKEAIKEVLPNVAHRFCACHLYHNACEAIKNSKFLDGLKHLIYGALATLCFTLCESASKNRDDFMEIRDDIFGLIQKLKKRHDPDSNVLSNVCLVSDPTVVKTKGVPRQIDGRQNLDTRVVDTSLRSKKYKRRCSNINNVHKSGQPNSHDIGKTCQPNPIDSVKFQNQHLNGLPVYPTFVEFCIPPYHPYNGTPLYQSYSPYYYNVSNENLFWNGGVHDLNGNRKQ